MVADSLCAICVGESAREGVGCAAGPVHWIFEVQVQGVPDKVEQFANIYLEQLLNNC